MPTRNSIVLRLILVITLAGAAIFGAALGYQYSRSRAFLQQELESNARNLAMSLVHRVETQLVAATKVTEGLARAVETSRPGEAGLLSLLRSTMDLNPAIHGLGVAFEPRAFDPDTHLYAPFYQRDPGASPCGGWNRPTDMSPTCTGTGIRSPGSWGAPSGASPTSTRGVATSSCAPAQCHFTSARIPAVVWRAWRWPTSPSMNSPS